MYFVVVVVVVEDNPRSPSKQSDKNSQQLYTVNKAQRKALENDQTVFQGSVAAPPSAVRHGKEEEEGVQQNEDSFRVYDRKGIVKDRPPITTQGCCKDSFSTEDGDGVKMTLN